MRIAMLTSWGDQCGIADYAHRLVSELQKTVELEIIPLDKKFRDQGRQYFSTIAEKLATFDLVHIQHEFSFFGGGQMPPCYGRWWLPPSLREFAESKYFFYLVERIQTPVILTLHELPDAVNIKWRSGASMAMLVSQYAVKCVHNRISRRANAITFGVADVVITHSDERRVKLADMGVSLDRIVSIPIGIPQFQNLPGLREAKQSLELTGKRVLSLFGFVNSRKGHFDAMALLQKLPSDVILLIVGGRQPEDNSGYYEDLLIKIKKSNLRDRVRITGYVPESALSTYLMASDLVIAPFENMGGNSASVMMAVAAGKVVIGWNLEPMVEIGKRVNSIQLIPKGNFDALAKSVMELLVDCERRRALEQSAVAAARKFSVGSEARQIVDVYRSVLSSPDRLIRRPFKACWPWENVLKKLFQEDIKTAFRSF